MGILIDESTRAVVQGITGKQGTIHTKLMLDYGTRIVAGVTPGKRPANTKGVPVYDTVREATQKYSPNASIIFVPAASAADAALEAIDNGIKIIVLITEGLPIKDSIEIMAQATRKNATVIGPNSPGVITPSKCKLGIMPSHLFKKGNIGIVSRSGTLTYEIAASLTKENMGQSTCLGIGGDPITGLNFTDALKMFKQDPQTHAIVLIGEIGGNIEELTAEYIQKEGYPKPIVAYIAGKFAPTGKRMGHAGAIITADTGTAETKIKALEKAGVKIASRPSEIPQLISKVNATSQTVNV
jgi:succinyl-CoA synthetase alpha subunit